MENQSNFLNDFYNNHMKNGVIVEQLVSDDIKEFAAPHWLSFPPSNPFFAVAIAIFYAILTVVILSANGFIIFLFVKEPSLRTPNNLFVLNLSISDFLLILCEGPPIVFAPFYGYYWSYGSTACTLYGFAGGVFGVVSIWTAVFIGYDRYNRIAVKYKK